MPFIAGLISVTDQATIFILINILLLNYMFAFGLETASCTLIGNALGAGDMETARKYAKTLTYVTSGIIFIFIASIYLC